MSIPCRRITVSIDVPSDVTDEQIVDLLDGVNDKICDFANHNGIELFSSDTDVVASEFDV
jgi:hypothetical protein